MSNRIGLCVAALTSLLSCISFSAKAETYCVSTAAQLRAAIDDAGASASASEIRVRKGFYSLPAASATAVSLTYSAPSDLKISGGWDGSNGTCVATVADPATTVLSTDGVGRLLNIQMISGAGTNIELQFLGFRNGAAGSSGLGGCINVDSDAGTNGTLNIDNNAFRLCSTAGTGAALVLRARSLDVRMRNNVFADNVSQLGIIRLSGLGGSVLYFSNNTLVNNPQIDLDGGPGGMQIGAQPNDLVWFSNNVLWNNGSSNGYDLLVSNGTPMVLNNNLIGKMAPLPVGIPNNNMLSSDPGFVSASDFAPRADSPMRNSGVTPNGGVTLLDQGATNRVQGVRIDRGAYEFSELFANGFE
jgi:hypothetical protein